MKPWNRLAALAGLNLVVFAACYSLAAQDHGASFEGLVPALICYGTLFASVLLGGFGWNEILKEIRRKHVSWQAALSTILAVAPLLFYAFGDVLPRRLKSRNSEQPNNSLQPVGLWRSENGTDTIEFFKDGSVRMTNVVNAPNRAVTLPMGGTYTVGASNMMTVTFSNWPGAFPPVPAGLSNDVLYLQALSVNGEFVKFQRLR